MSKNEKCPACKGVGSSAAKITVTYSNGTKGEEKVYFPCQECGGTGEKYPKYIKQKG